MPARLAHPPHIPRRCVDVPILGEVCEDDNPLREACAALAQGYFEAVDSLWQESFDRSQADQEEHVQQCQEAADGSGGQ